MTTNSTEQKSDHICPHKFAFMLDNWFRKLLQNPKKILGEYINKGNTVMDVGCGPGFFSIDMAKMVGETGKVIAVDLQPQMLEKVKRKATRKGVVDRMTFHQCGSTGIGLDQKVDFILAFYVIHETPNSKEFLAELKQMLNQGGKLLVVEPKMHVTQEKFDIMLKHAREAGLQVAGFPTGKGGRSVLFTN